MSGPFIHRVFFLESGEHSPPTEKPTVADINRLNHGMIEMYDLDTEVRGVMESRLSALKSKEAQL